MWVCKPDWGGEGMKKGQRNERHMDLEKLGGHVGRMQPDGVAMASVTKGDLSCLWQGSLASGGVRSLRL